MSGDNFLSRSSEFYDEIPCSKDSRFSGQNRADDPALAEAKERLLAELRRWQKETADGLADSQKLTQLTAEHDALEKPYIRKQNFQWRYPKYLRPNGLAGQ